MQGFSGGAWGLTQPPQFPQMPAQHPSSLQSCLEATDEAYIPPLQEEKGLAQGHQLGPLHLHLTPAAPHPSVGQGGGESRGSEGLSWAQKAGKHSVSKAGGNVGSGLAHT